jgi:hypothetical protein
MEAEDLLRTVTSPDAWLAKSVTLRRSANALWNDFFWSTLESGEAGGKASETNEDTNWEKAMGFLSVAKMLYGMAIEAALKGHLIRVSPGATKLELVADGSGKVVEVEVKQLGVSMGQGHDLVRLAENAKAFVPGNIPGFSDWNIDTLRDVLRDLTEHIIWAGRYPVPRRSGSQFLPAAETPYIAFQHALRDFIDPFLDRYQPNADPSLGSQAALDRMIEIIQERRKQRSGS